MFRCPVCIMRVIAWSFLAAEYACCVTCLEYADNHMVNNYIKFVSDEWKNAFRCSDRSSLSKSQQVRHLKNRMIYWSLDGFVFTEHTVGFSKGARGSSASWNIYMQIDKLLITSVISVMWKQELVEHWNRCSEKLENFHPWKCSGVVWARFWVTWSGFGVCILWAKSWTRNFQPCLPVQILHRVSEPIWSQGKRSNISCVTLKGGDAKLSNRNVS